MLVAVATFGCDGLIFESSEAVTGGQTARAKGSPRNLTLKRRLSLVTARWETQKQDRDPSQARLLLSLVEHH